jgi:hypothetical protein
MAAARQSEPDQSVTGACLTSNGILRSLAAPAIAGL